MTIPRRTDNGKCERLDKRVRTDVVHVNNLNINYLVPDGPAAAFVGRIVSKQGKCMIHLQRACDEKGTAMVAVLNFDAEVRWLFGLKVMTESIFSASGDAK